MMETIGTVLRLVLEVLGAATVPEQTALAVAVAAVAAVVVVAVALAAVGLPVSAAGSSPHPRRAIDVSAQLTQSDPDAPGHARPRAPGLAASAA
jgi:hypothetical protein